MQSEVTFSRPGLVVYSFVPKELPSYPDKCAEAHAYLRQLWSACGKLGITEREPNLDLPVVFPNEVNADPAFRLVAAKVDLKRRLRGEDYQSFLFEYQDVFGLMANFEAADEATELSKWGQLQDEWFSAIGKLDQSLGVMGEVMLFTGLYKQGDSTTEDWISSNHLLSSTIPRIGREVIKALPGSDGAEWRAKNFYITNSGDGIWDVPPHNGSRTVALIAPLANREEVFSRTVWAGPRQLPVFTAYLMQWAKLQFAQNVFEREIVILREQAHTVDRALTSVLSLYTKADKDGFWDMNQITRVHHNLILEQMKNYGLLYGISRLKELLLTLRIADRNMRQLVPDSLQGTLSNLSTMFGQDRARSEWLREQVEADLGYLQALRERTEEGHKIATMLLEREREKTTRRLSNLVLLEGALLGSITIGLLMLPAFEIHDFNLPLVWAVVGLLMGVALALPPLFARWHETYKLIDRLAAGFFGASLLLFIVIVWETAGLRGSEASFNIRLAFKVVVGVLGFFLGYLAVGRLENMKAAWRAE